MSKANDNKQADCPVDRHRRHRVLIDGWVYEDDGSDREYDIEIVIDEQKLLDAIGQAIRIARHEKEYANGGFRIIAKEVKPK